VPLVQLFVEADQWPRKNQDELRGVEPLYTTRPRRRWRLLRYFYRSHCHCYRFLYCSIFIRQVCFDGLASIPTSAIQLSVWSQGFVVFPEMLLSVSTATVV